jgi:hypothetical protein
VERPLGCMVAAAAHQPNQRHTTLFINKAKNTSTKTWITEYVAAYQNRPYKLELVDIKFDKLRKKAKEVWKWVKMHCVDFRLRLAQLWEVLVHTRLHRKLLQCRTCRKTNARLSTRCREHSLSMNEASLPLLLRYVCGNATLTRYDVSWDGCCFHCFCGWFPGSWEFRWADTPSLKR